MHLYELAQVCAYLDNTAENGASTVTIANWLRLAGQLRAVDVDTSAFDWDSPMCGGPADYWRDTSVHYSQYATTLTRYVFVRCAIDEMYRLMEPRYDQAATVDGIPKKKRPRNPSIKAAKLADTLAPADQPVLLTHLTCSYQSLYAQWVRNHRITLTGMDQADSSLPGYTLHLLRNLRNSVAHGEFPLMAHPDYHDFDAHNSTRTSEEGVSRLMQLLECSSRLSAIFIQALIARFNDGFCSPGYQMHIGATAPESTRFVRECNQGYIRNLHLRGSFSLADAFNYDLRPWEQEH